MNWFDRHIDQNYAVFIVAEAGINHNGYFDLALELIKQAKQAGADCVKFQAFRTTSSESKHSSMPGYFDGRIGKMTKQEWSRSLEFTVEEFSTLKTYCEELDIAFLSTACDIEGLRILQKIGAGAVKLASADTNNDYLLRAVGETGLPAILSSGMSDMAAIEHAFETLHKFGNRQIALLQCTSQYPAPYDQLNLRVIETFRKKFGCPVGLSDHSEGIHIPLAAVALGAQIIEKHFTLSRNLPGVDHAASLEPDQFKEMVRCIQEIEGAMGSGKKKIQPDEIENAKNMSRSLMAARPLSAGTRLTMEDITAKRPGTGLPPTEIDKLLGRRLVTDMEPEDFFSPEIIEGYE
ncbi:MAG: N-acetylneuraminate synthase family protein [Nitrospinaceae bacterium]|jgi:sialic acid synthase SpsE|nr:N-acetylneuraminate synthase family protein [Nitrospinaceae bacterium]